MHTELNLQQRLFLSPFISVGPKSSIFQASLRSSRPLLLPTFQAVASGCPDRWTMYSVTCERVQGLGLALTLNPEPHERLRSPKPST